MFYPAFLTEVDGDMQSKGCDWGSLSQKTHFQGLLHGAEYVFLEQRPFPDFYLANHTVTWDFTFRKFFTLGQSTLIVIGP